ncbi:hypothetical protein [Streptomyces sp. V3I7]|uniref:hypothetical protein n=1 Tax=Streptomyces sp. V3I7 TaxID=3042278 RepID=UPI002788C0AE|nr:hypothetical protein [Streptomyces sp. V3I7]MDQ0992188.1 hypothetical protein [Streptomyces sp. V3I7]
MDHKNPSAPASALITTPEPGDLDVAVSVAQQMLTAYEGVDYSDIGMLAQAHGALRESLRILLRALDAQTAGAQ